MKKLFTLGILLALMTIVPLQNVFAQTSTKLQVTLTTEAGQPGYLTCPQEHNAINPSATDKDGDGVPAMIDGNPSTYMHTAWKNVPAGPHYFQVDLGDGNALSSFAFDYQTRSGEVGYDFPAEFTIKGSNDDSNYEQITVLDVSSSMIGAGREYNSERIDCTKTYRYLRFEVTDTDDANGGTTGYRTYFHIAEFKLYEYEDYVPVYNVTVSVNDDTLGSATKSLTGEEIYSLTATANSGCAFKNWTINGVEVSTENPYSYTATADVEIVANFEKVYFTDFGTSTSSGKGALSKITFNINGEAQDIATGKENSSGAIYVNKVSEVVTVVAGEEVSSLTTTGSVGNNWMHGYLYVDWNNDKSFTKELNNYIPTENSELIAYGFWSGTDGDGNHGGVSDASGYNHKGNTINDSTTPNRSTNGALESFTIPANIPAGDYRARYKLDWNCINPEAVLDFAYGAMVLDFTLRVEQPVPTYTVTVTPSDATMGTVSPETATIAEGQTVTISATPNEGYEFVNWTIDGSAGPNTNPWEFPVTEDLEFIANFQIIPGSTTYNITVASADETMGSATATATEVIEGKTVTLTATANEGYRFVNWTVNDEEVSTEATYEATITAETAFVANFEAIPTFTVNVSTNDATMGTVSPETLKVEVGTSVTLTATANEGAEFVNWTVNDEEVSTNPTYTFAVSADVDVKANFIHAYCKPSVATQGTDASYVGQIVTLTTTGAAVDANWTNPKTENFNGSTSVIENTFTAEAGQTVTLNIADKNTTWGWVRVYVDLNGNYIFDDGEQIFADTNRARTQPISQQFTIANTVEAGTYLMRIFYVGGNDTSKGVCDSYSEGGYFDFEFNVTAPLVIEERTITVKANNDAWGIVEGGATSTSRVTISATANEGYQFVNWTIEGDDTFSSTSTTYVDETAGSKTYIANFEEIPTYTVKVTLPDAEQGSIEINGEAAQASYTVLEGTAVEMTATPAFGYIFSKWSINGSEYGDNPFSVPSVTVDATVEAVFTKLTDEEAYASICKPEYSHSGNNNNTYVSVAEINGESIEVPALVTPSNGKGNVQEGSTTPIEVVAGEEFILDLTFVKNFGDVRLFQIEKGNTIAPVKTYGPYEGSWVESGNHPNPLDAMAAEGLTVDGFKASFPFTFSESLPIGEIAIIRVAIGDCTTPCALGVSEGGYVDFIFKMVPAPIPTYAVTAEASPVEGGQVTISANEVEENETVTLTATANEGYEFVNWTVEGTEVSAEANFTSEAITAETAFVANFVKQLFNVTVTAGEGGSVEPVSSPVEYGSTITLSATANEGYEFTRWSSPAEETLYYIQNYSTKKYLGYNSVNLAPVDTQSSDVTVASSTLTSGAFTFHFTNATYDQQTPPQPQSYMHCGSSGRFSGNSVNTANSQQILLFKVADPTAETITATQATEIISGATYMFVGLKDDTYYALTDELYKGGTVEQRLVGAAVTITDGVITFTPGTSSALWTISNKSFVSDENPYNVTITADSEFIANFQVKEYTITYKVDGEEYATETYDFGATVTPVEAPTKAGYTFSGWSTIPTTMPANDVEVIGTFTIIPNLDVTAENKEEVADATYLNVTVANEKVWDVKENTIAADKVSVKVETNGAAPEVKIADGGQITTVLEISRVVEKGKWALMSLPFAVDLANVTVDGAPAANNSNIKVMVYDAAYRAANSVEDWTKSGWVDLVGTTIAANQGFAVAINANNGDEQTVTFTATAQTYDGADKQIALSRYASTVNGGADADWNFYGNPTLAKAQKGTGYALYVYNAEDDSYDEYASSDVATYLPYAAWFVQSADDFNAMSFSAGVAGALAEANGVYGELQFSLNGEDEARVVLVDESSEEYVRNEDALYFPAINANLSQLYLVKGNIKMAVSEQPTLTSMAMGYKAVKAGEQTLTLTSMPENTSVVLVDNVAGTETAMTLGDTYTFQSEAGTFNNRFVIETTDLTGIAQAVADGEVKVIVSGDDIKVYGAEAGTEVVAYTTNGTVVASAVATDGVTTLSTTASGVIVVKVANTTVKVIK